MDGALVGAGSTTLLGVGHLALSQFPSLCGSCNDNNNNNNMRRRYTCVLFWADELFGRGSVHGKNGPSNFLNEPCHSRPRAPFTLLGRLWDGSSKSIA